MGVATSDGALAGALRARKLGEECVGAMDTILIIIMVLESLTHHFRSTLCTASVASRTVFDTARKPPTIATRSTLCPLDTSLGWGAQTGDAPPHKELPILHVIAIIMIAQAG